jgi:ABC-type branched-subunit amino acid transport system substrate-binding protein
MVAVAAVMLIALTACSRSDNATKTDTTGATTATDATSGAPGNGQFGTITTPVCNPAPAGQTNTASAQGVTADSITVGTISDVGFSGAPGLNQELFDASDVFVDWCNSLGGINGRQIKIDKLDAKVLEYKDRITEACGRDFTLTGGGGVFDDAGQETRLKCLLPDFPGYLVTPKARGADLTVQSLPYPLNKVNFAQGKYLSETFPDSVDHVGYLTGNVPATIVSKQQAQEAGTQIGWKTVYDDQYNAIGEPTWVPFAQSIKDKGVKGLYYVGEPVNLGKLVSALDQIDYKLDWIAGAGNQYDAALVESAGASLDTNNVYSATSVTPFLAADKVPAVAQYEELFKKYLPNGKSEAALGLNSFNAWLLWAQSAKSCGADLTRKCIVEAGQSVTSWDGGGIAATSDPAANDNPAPCLSLQKATASGFTLINWNSDDGGVFTCNQDYIVTLTGDYGQGAKLADVGLSMADLK